MSNRTERARLLALNLSAGEMLEIAIEPGEVFPLKGENSMPASDELEEMESHMREAATAAPARAARRAELLVRQRADFEAIRELALAAARSGDHCAARAARASAAALETCYLVLLASA